MWAYRRFPVENSVYLLDRLGYRAVQNVDEASVLPPHVYDVRLDRSYSELSFVRRLSSAARVEGRYGRERFHARRALSTFARNSCK